MFFQECNSFPKSGGKFKIKKHKINIVKKTSTHSNNDIDTEIIKYNRTNSECTNGGHNINKFFALQDTNFRILPSLSPISNSGIIYFHLLTDYTHQTQSKGINIDNLIIKEALLSIAFPSKNIKETLLNTSSCTFYSTNTNPLLFHDIPLDGEYYVFSETLFNALFIYLLEQGKKVILIPNIDSYTTFIPKQKNSHWFTLLNQLLQRFPKTFFIWAKTKQMYEWIKECTSVSPTYINFSAFHFSPHFEQQCEDIDHTNSANNSFYDYYADIAADVTVANDYFLPNISRDNALLLDTGISTTKRKYVTEIMDIFKHNVQNPLLHFVLVVKTVPKVYDKYNLKKYEHIPNIVIFNQEIPSLHNLNIFYRSFLFCIYLAKFDGFGLSLSQAINNNMFIFCGNGLPWNELLAFYPRKCLIKVEQNFEKSMGTHKAGYARSQIYYKANFKDLETKLLMFHAHEKIIQATQEETLFFNYINNHIFLSNIHHFFRTNTNTYNIDAENSKRVRHYTHSGVFLTSYNERMYILIENLMQIIFQTAHIHIYLNETNAYTNWWLSKCNNITVVPFWKDLKALGKLYGLCHSPEYDWNLIIDDDIIYPTNYVSYTISHFLDDVSANVNTNTNINPKKCLYSYNGFDAQFKYSFVKKHKTSPETPIVLKSIGTGTSFYHKNTFSKKKILNVIMSQKTHIFADKCFSEFLTSHAIPMQYVNPQFNCWMINNVKITLNKIPGLFEYKKNNKLIDTCFISTLMPKNIAYKKILFQFSENSIPMSTALKRKIEYLKSYFYVKCIYHYENPETCLQYYDYFVNDDNCTSSKQNIVSFMLNIHTSQKHTNINLTDFVCSV